MDRRAIIEWILWKRGRGEWRGYRVQGLGFSYKICKPFYFLYPIPLTLNPKHTMNRAYLVVIAVMILGILGAVLVVRTKGTKSISKTPTPTQEETEPTTPEATVSAAKKQPSPTVKPLTDIAVPLDVISPKDKSIATQSAIFVKGTTKANAEVIINDLETSADSKGNFSGKLTLDEGDNPIVVVAIDEDGNSSEKEIMVTYEIQ